MTPDFYIFASKMTDINCARLVSITAQRGWLPKFYALRLKLVFLNCAFFVFIPLCICKTRTTCWFLRTVHRQFWQSSHLACSYKELWNFKQFFEQFSSYFWTFLRSSGPYAYGKALWMHKSVHWLINQFLLIRKTFQWFPTQGPSHYYRSENAIMH